MIFLEFSIEFLNLVLLFERCSACENSLFFLVSSKRSPERHNRITLIFIDEPLILHNDVGDFLEIDGEESHEFFWFHILRNTRKSGDIGEETRDSHTFSIEFYFLELIEDIDHELF